MPKLNLNVDHVATLRQARRGKEPDPVSAAMVAEFAGASGIVLHLREDRRHAQERDLEVLRKLIQTKLNMEMAATEEMVGIAKKIIPDLVTIVPENRQEITTEGGLDVAGNMEWIKKTVSNLQDSDLFISLFIDPDKNQIEASKEIGADMVEIHTGMYAEAKNEKNRKKELGKIINSVKKALNIGLRISAGHGLNYHNVQEIASIDGIEDLNIGHSIVSRALLVGMERAVRDMVLLCGD